MTRPSARQIGVVGAGTMGAGIAQAAAAAGFPVTLYDVTEAILADARTRIATDLERLVRRGRLASDAAQAAAGRIVLATQLDQLAACDVIIEAAPEDLALKRDLFRGLDALAPNAVLASNTSSLSITALAGAVSRPERVVGMHFFNPAPLMPLVEVIPGRSTSRDVVEQALTLARALGKTPVEAQDTPGFVVNRIARPYYGEPLRLLGERAASVEAIDRIMREAGGFRMGPFELLDLIGLDVNLAVTQSVYDAFFQEPRFRPHPLQQRMVEAGLLGRKVGRGFYQYADGRKQDRDTSAESPGIAPRARRPIGSVWIVSDGALFDELTAGAHETTMRVSVARDPEREPPSEAALVVEALVDPEAKRTFLRRLPDGQAVIATLGLTASTSVIAAGARTPERVVGYATLPPLKERRLIEVMPGRKSSPEAVEVVCGFFEGLGKQTQIVQEGPGGIYARVFAMIVNEAMFALAEGVARAADIDLALRLGASYPQGPLESAHAVGLGTVLAILEGLHQELGEDRYRPAPLLRQFVAAGGHIDVG